MMNPAAVRAATDDATHVAILATNRAVELLEVSWAMNRSVNDEPNLAAIWLALDDILADPVSR
jgi:hypothetical protein